MHTYINVSNRLNWQQIRCKWFALAQNNKNNNLRDYNKKGQLKKELSALCLQKYIVEHLCSSQSQALITLARLQSRGITEDRILELNNFLENNGYKDMKPNIWY